MGHRDGRIGAPSAQPPDTGRQYRYGNVTDTLTGTHSSDERRSGHLDTDDLTDQGMLRAFLAPCLLVAASVLSLAGIGVAAAHRLSAAPPSCTRLTSSPARSTCP